MISRRGVIGGLIAAPASYLLLGLQDETRLSRLVGTAMGTSYRIVLPAPSVSNAVKQSVENTLSEINMLFSTWREDSWISGVNRAPAGQTLAVPEPARALVAAAAKLGAKTEGRFDVTSLPLLSLWGFGPNAGHNRAIPMQREIDTALGCTGQDKLIINSGAKTLTKTNGQTRLDYSAIAKGYAVDKITAQLITMGYVDFIIEFGGDLYAAGSGPGKTGWDVKTPSGDILNLTDEAVATSGPEHNHRAGVCHIIDPRSGRALAMQFPVTVRAKTCTEADAFATTQAVRQAETYQEA